MPYVKVLVTEVTEYVLEIDEDTAISKDGFYFDDVLAAVEHNDPQEIYIAMMAEPPSPSVRSASVYLYDPAGSLILGKPVSID